MSAHVGDPEPLAAEQLHVQHALVHVRQELAARGGGGQAQAPVSVRGWRCSPRRPRETDPRRETLARPSAGAVREWVGQRWHTGVLPSPANPAHLSVKVVLLPLMARS